jgi:hypothetical protein
VSGYERCGQHGCGYKFVPSDPVNEPDFGYFTAITDGHPAHLVCPDCAADHPQPWYDLTSYGGIDCGGDPYRDEHCEDCGVLIHPAWCRVCRWWCSCISYHELDNDLGDQPGCTCEHSREVAR